MRNHGREFLTARPRRLRVDLAQQFESRVPGDASLRIPSRTPVDVSQRIVRLTAFGANIRGSCRILALEVVELRKTLNECRLRLIQLSQFAMCIRDPAQARHGEQLELHGLRGTRAWPHACTFVAHS